MRREAPHLIFNKYSLLKKQEANGDALRRHLNKADYSYILE
jgi:hypothetical protein